MNSNTYLRCLLVTSFYILHITTLVAVNAFTSVSSPNSIFASPSYAQQRTSTYPQSSSSLQVSSIDGINASYPKIKSPSNYYTQFYKDGVLVGIESTSSNSRRISGEIIIDTPIDAIWSILTDYDNLSVHVPNLVDSKVINNGDRIVGSTPRVYQKGAQKIFGFEFGADVTMDMTENVFVNAEPNKMYSIDFECVDSQFFSQFDGAWVVQEYDATKTMVKYIVDVKPKGPVPVAALEWRIKEDVPINIMSVAEAAARRAKIEKKEMSQKEYDQLEGISSQKTQPQAQEPRSSRTQQLPPSPQEQANQSSNNPLQQLAENAKQTAKQVLPEPIYSFSRRAVKTVDKANPLTRAAIALSPNPVGTVLAMTLLSGDDSNQDSSTRRRKPAGETRKKSKENRLSSKETLGNNDVGWYEDETLSTYLKKKK